MDIVDTSSRLAQVLICVNQRPDSKLPCCQSAGGLQVYDRFDSWVRDRSLSTRIWVTKTGCMGWCHTDGATVAFYPEDRWYRAVDLDDSSRLIERHLRPLVEPSPS